MFHIRCSDQEYGFTVTGVCMGATFCYIVLLQSIHEHPLISEKGLYRLGSLQLMSRCMLIDAAGPVHFLLSSVELRGVLLFIILESADLRSDQGTA